MAHALVCAYNEEGRIYKNRGPLSPAIEILKTGLMNGLTIVNDGSTDNTQNEIFQALEDFNFSLSQQSAQDNTSLTICEKTHGVFNTPKIAGNFCSYQDQKNRTISVITHAKNQGKTRAVFSGLTDIINRNEGKFPPIFFFDADLKWLSIDHYLQLLYASYNHEEGYLIRGLLDPLILSRTNIASNLFPALSGIRLVSPNILADFYYNLCIHKASLRGYQIELFMEEVVKRLHKDAYIKNERLDSLTQTDKEQKALQSKSFENLTKRFAMWWELLTGLYSLKKLKLTQQ